MKKNLIIVIILTIIVLFSSFNIFSVKAETNIYLIESIPSGAATYINDKYMGITPYKLINNDGNSTLKLIKGGYAEIIKKITIENGKETLGLVKLRKRSAVYFKSNPFQISYSIKETKQTGLTPVIIDNLEAGNYTIVFSKDGFKDVTKKVSLNGGLILMKIDLEETSSDGGEIIVPEQPTKEYTKVSVKTSTDDCQIYLNGIYKGLSPLVLSNLEVEKIYKISAYKSGFNSDYVNYKVERDGSVTLVLSKQTIKYASLNIKTNLSATNIYVNGIKYVGNNITVSSLKVGSVIVVKVSKTGYLEQAKTITLKEGENSLLFTLTKPISVLVDSNPGGAILLFTKNGFLTKMGPTPIKLEGLIPGTQYVIVLQKDGYKSVSFKFTAVKDGDILTFTLDLIN